MCFIFKSLATKSQGNNPWVFDPLLWHLLTGPIVAFVYAIILDVLATLKVLCLLRGRKSNL